MNKDTAVANARRQGRATVSGLSELGQFYITRSSHDGVSSTITNFYFVSSPNVLTTHQYIRFPPSKCLTRLKFRTTSMSPPPHLKSNAADDSLRVGRTLNITIHGVVIGVESPQECLLISTRDA